MYRALTYLNNNYTINVKFSRKKLVLLETYLPLSNEGILLVTCALFCVNIGRIAPNFRSKTLTVKNKNLNFQYFLSPSTKTTYNLLTPKNSRFFGSKVHTHLSIEAQFF